MHSSQSFPHESEHPELNMKGLPFKFRHFQPAVTRTVIHGICLLSLVLLASGARVQAFSKAVAAEGTILPAGGAFRVAVSPPQAVLAELRVKEGDWLEAGQVIAVLQGAATLQAQTMAAQSAVEAAEAAVQIAQQQASVASAQVAKMVATANEARERHAAAIAKIERHILDLQQLLKEQDPPKRDRLEVEFNIRQLQRERREQLAVFPVTLKRIEAEVAAVRAQSLVAELRVTAARADVSGAQARLEGAKARQAEATVQAPRAGEVIEVFARVGEAVGSYGILEMGNTREISVEAEVSIDDIANVELGHSARITGDGIAVYLEGVVVGIERKVARNALRSGSPSAYQDRSVINVTIRLNEEDSQQVRRLLNAQVIARIKPPTYAQ